MARPLKEQRFSLRTNRKRLAGTGDPDRDRIATTLAGFAANPNCYATVLIGIRKEDTAIAEEAVRRGGRIHLVAMADNRGTAGTVAATRPLLERLLAEASRQQREPMPFRLREQRGRFLGLPLPAA